ncbi:MAG: PspC domain-containing protein [Leadbetterella sp.]|jgi:phage shock protein PspC (stress-responsive transcriptional regulator)|nr:PspC domain-containing protein [Leadbetterella sp.]MBP8156115.1 PspC domain-containing protein [Leadbetterella sp.]
MEKKLKRTIGKEAMFMGICGGLGKYFDLDPTIVRILVALTTFFSFGSLTLVYIILAFIIPKEDSINI